VPSDTSSISDAYTKILTKGTLNRFAFRTSMQLTDLSSKYKPSGFIRDYHLSEADWLALNDECKKDSSYAQFSETERKQIEEQIKILMARNYWKRNGLFEAQCVTDENVKKAIESMK